MVEGDSKTGVLGNSSLFCPLNLNFPLSEEISIPKFSILTEKVRGCSEKVFKASIKNFAGTAIAPSSFASISNLEEIVVSKSEAKTVSSFP